MKKRDLEQMRADTAALKTRVGRLTETIGAPTCLVGPYREAERALGEACERLHRAIGGTPEAVAPPAEFERLQRDHELFVGFLASLVAEPFCFDAAEIVAVVEKPHKWTDEFAAWKEAL